MRSYAGLMSIRTLFAVLVALAVLFAPSVTSPAMASAPDHQMQMMQAGNCEMPVSGKSGHDKMDGNCCIAMCTATAVPPSVPVLEKHVPGKTAYFSAPLFSLGSPIELPTPPPRRS